MFPGWPSGLDFSTEILGKVSHQFIESGEVPDCIRLCELPAAISSAGRLVHSGLCVLVRRIIRDAHSEHPDSHLNQLLVSDLISTAGNEVSLNSVQYRRSDFLNRYVVGWG